jgi:hypothetical protein
MLRIFSILNHRTLSRIVITRVTIFHSRQLKSIRTITGHGRTWANFSKEIIVLLDASNCYVPLCRRLADDDDELSEVQPDAVPPEVREWLASTFTRQLATTRRKSDEKPKFRSVAHAIRAGIFVDRIYRRVSNTTLMQFPPDVVRVLKVSSDIYEHWPFVQSWLRSRK